MSNFTVEEFFDTSEFPNKAIFDGITNVWDALVALDGFIASQFANGLQSNYQGKENVFVGEGTVIEEGVFIKGPAIIGKNCLIRHGAYLRENVLLGNNVLVHHGAEIKHAILLNNSFAPHVGYVGNSIIGNNVNIAAGAVLANYRLDKKEVHVLHEQEKIPTGLTKFGSIIGDGGSIGVNAVLNPGTILGKKTTVYPLTSVKGVHSQGSVIR